MPQADSLFENSINRLFSGLGIGLGMLSQEGTVLSWTAEIARHLGKSGSEVLGKPIWEIYPELGALALGSAFSAPADLPLAEVWQGLFQAVEAQGQSLSFSGCDRQDEEGKPLRISLSLQCFTFSGERRMFVISRDDGEWRGMPRDLIDPETGIFPLSYKDKSASFWEYDGQRDRLRANQAWCARFDLPCDADFNYTLEDYLLRVHPEDLKNLQSIIDAFMQDPGREYGLEYRLKDAEGAYVWVFDRNVSQERAPDGTLLRCVGKITDINQRKELEFSNDEKSRLLRDVLDQSPQYIFARDAQGRFILANKALAQFYGRKPQDLIGMRLEELHPDKSEAKRFLSDDRHVILTGESLLIPETNYTSPSGKRSIIELSLAPFKVPGLKEGASLGFGIDITEMKRVQRALYEEKDRLSVTLRSLGEGVIATDTAGRVVLMNPMAASITGFDEREALGKPIGQVFRIRYGSDSHPLSDPVRDILAERRIVSSSADSYLEKRSGELREISERGAPIIDEEGEVSGAVLIFLDVTERRAMEREIEKIQKVESLGILAGGIAHDFNNILMAVLGNISLAKLNVDESQENYSLLAEAEKAILQAKRLTAQLSLMAKGGADPRKESISVRGFIEEACSINLRGSNVGYVLDIAPDVDLLHADPSQMNQVMQNLVLNAREAMPMGGTVNISARLVSITRAETLPLSPGPYLKIDVQDSGPGMHPEIAQRIFDPYYTTKSRGSGLGLTVSFSVVKKHGGCITVKSRLGEGTVFSVYLPGN